MQVANATHPLIQKKATSILVAFFIAATAHAYLEENEWLFIGAALLAAVLYWWNDKSYFAAALAAILMGCVVSLGSPAAPLLVLIVCASYGGLRAGVGSALAICLVGHVYPPLVAWLSESPFSSFTTLASLGVPLAPLLCFYAIDRAWLAATIALSIACGADALLFVAMLGDWIPSGLLDHSGYRALIALAPALASLRAPSVVPQPLQSNRLILAAAALVVAPILILPLALPIHPIKRIVFDESHGDWATTTKTFGPTDFGRDHSYTYGLLADYSRRLVPEVSRYMEGELRLGEDDFFIMKMPTVSPSPQFVKQLGAWVRRGGRLMVVLDHTDLFDTTQNANALLAELAGVTVGARAVFAADGRPNVIGPTFGKPLRGHVLGVMEPFLFQTGTSFARIPMRYFGLAAHGATYSEAAEYFRPNRFGYFQSDPHTPDANHLAAMAIPVSEGLVVIITDSTPWSNFLMFRAAYRDAYRHFIDVAQNTAAIRGYVAAIAVAAFVLLLLVAIRTSLVALLGGSLIGVVVGLSITATKVAWFSAKPGRDFNVQVAVGASATTEALTQLVPPGTNNYARLLSGIQKFGIVPRLERNSTSARKLQPNTSILLVEPSVDDLPEPEEILRHVQAGNNVVLLFRSDQVGAPGQREWLAALRLGVLPVRSLGRAEAPELRLEERTQPPLVRHLVYRLSALPESRLWEQEQDAFAQAFAVRPVQYNLSQPAGFLVISFQAEQFSDDAVGDIWEGKLTTEIARDREKRVAALLGFSKPVNTPESNPRVVSVDLQHYTVLRDGTLLVEGSLPRKVQVAAISSLGTNPDEYIASLQRQALDFIKEQCLSAKRCDRSFIGEDLVEWHVFFQIVKGNLAALELVHDRRFGGLGASYHVILTAEK